MTSGASRSSIPLLDVCGTASWRVASSAWPTPITGLIYVDAALPYPGQSWFDTAPALTPDADLRPLRDPQTADDEPPA